MHYFSRDRALITGLSLPLSPVYFPIKTIVTATGNSNHLNHSSFVEDRGMWWMYHWGLEVIDVGSCAALVSPRERCLVLKPYISDTKEMGYQSHLRLRRLKRITNRLQSSLAESVYNLQTCRCWKPACCCFWNLHLTTTKLQPGILLARNLLCEKPMIFTNKIDRVLMLFQTAFRLILVACKTGACSLNSISIPTTILFFLTPCAPTMISITATFLSLGIYHNIGNFLNHPPSAYPPSCQRQSYQSQWMLFYGWLTTE